MNWSDERYVRLFTRDSVTWSLWSWNTQAIFMGMLRKADRAGVIDVSDHDPAEAIAALLRAPLDQVRSALSDLEKSGTVVRGDHALVFPNYIWAQETPQSDKARQAESRAKRAAQSSLSTHKLVAGVTIRDEMSRGVTPGHAVSLRAVPCRAVPNHAETTLSNLQFDGEVVVDEIIAHAVADANHFARPKLAADSTDKAPAAKPKKPTTATWHEDERDVFEHWRVACNHPEAVPTTARRKLIAKWLRLYSVERLQAAIDGCARSPFHQGQNDRNKRYDSLELILRDAQHIEDFESQASR